MIKKNIKIAQEARKAFEKWNKGFKKNIDEYHRMQEFVFGRQWNDEEEDILEDYNKIPLQNNKLASLNNTMLGEQQQNTPQLEVVPTDNCDEEVAKIRELIVKQIMFSGDAKNVYQVAASQAFVGGYSAYAIEPKYLHEKSFDQDLHYKWFKDPTKCYWDLSAEKINKTDSMVYGWVVRVSRETLESKVGEKLANKIMGGINPIMLPKEEIAEISSPGTNPDYMWSDENSTTIQYHFKRTPVPETLYKLSNGHVVNQEEMNEIISKSKKIREEKIIEQRIQQELIRQSLSSNIPIDPMTLQDPNMAPGQYDPLLGQKAPTNGISAQEPVVPTKPEHLSDNNFDDDSLILYDDEEVVRIENSKDATWHKITQYELCGDYELDQTPVMSQQGNLVFVDQNSWYDKNGKQVCRPFLTDAVDTQRFINYLATQIAYLLKVSRYDQWIGSKRNVQTNDTARIWADPCSQQGLLTFDESPSGVVPQRIDPPEISQSLAQQYERAVQDLYTCTGLYPAQLGQQGNETSGKAIDGRTRQGSYSTFVAFNSINRAIAVGGEIVNEMIPKVYDATRVIALMTPDEGLKNIVINRQTDEYGEHIENDIRKGSYQVRLLPGPSREGQKEEALLSLNAAIQASPNVFPLIADLYAENLPLANTIELKNRFRTIVPPNILEAGKTGKPQKPQQQPPSPEAIEAAYKNNMLQLKDKEIIIKQQELQLKQQAQDADTRVEMAKLMQEQQAIQAQMNKDQMDYLAETQRSQNDLEIGHANNFAHILTSQHQPNTNKGEKNV